MPRPRQILALALASLPVALPPTAPAYAQAQPQKLEEVRDQGVHYYKKKLFKQAERQLATAYAMNGGPGDFETVYFRGLTAFQLDQVNLAQEMVQSARRLAVDARRKRAVDELEQQIRALYGPVVFKASPNETNRKGRIYFEAKTGIINPDKRRRFEQIREQYRAHSVTLPTTLYLPYGEYTANNVPFAVVEGASDPPTVEIFLQIVEEDVLAAAGDNDNTWLWVGIGTAAAVGIGVGAWLLLSDDAEPVKPSDPGLTGEL
ncbi:MAG: hypothetical protein R3F65_24085 [bacterium]